MIFLLMKMRLIQLKITRHIENQIKKTEESTALVN